MNENQYVIFKLADEFYAIKIDNVETIERDMEITRVPKTHGYVKGVINLRGEIVPVIDLRARLGLATKKTDIPPSTVEYSSFDGNISETYVKGIAKDHDRMIILLDVDKVLSL